MEKYVEVKAAQEFAGTFLSEPILKMAVNAVKSTLRKIRHGQRSTYEFVVDDSPYDEEDEI